jgi:hypothetical protein
MAHINLHLAEGLAFGTALTFVPLVRAWLGDRPVAGPIGRMAVAAFGFAAFAAFPSLLIHLGWSPRVHQAAWTNVFLGHAAIARRFRGGLLMGEIAIAAWLVGFYLLMLIAIWRGRRMLRADTRAAETPADSRTAYP